MQDLNREAQNRWHRGEQTNRSKISSDRAAWNALVVVGNVLAALAGPKER
jgi:hypothetical protein